MREGDSQLKSPEAIDFGSSGFRDGFMRAIYKVFGQKDEKRGARDVSSEHRIEMWNRSWLTVVHRMFFDEEWRPHVSFLDGVKQTIEDRFKGSSKRNGITYKYYSYDQEQGFHERINMGLDEIFKLGNKVVDLGCGFGAAAYGMAAMHPGTTIIGGDYEMGKKISIPHHSLNNLTYRTLDWRNLDLPDSSVDAWVSDQGVAKYGNSDAVAAELTRVSKPGAIFRASQERRLMIGQKTFAERLKALGWEVYSVVSIGKDGSSHFTDIVCAKLTNKPEPSEV